MGSVKIKLENCYGIKKLEHEFDFTQKPTYAIYAPNGVMKTSFAKTFADFSKGEDSRDDIFPDRPTTRNIVDERGNGLDPESVFVILPYVPDFTSEKIATLLVNKDLRKRYEEIHKDIDEKKDSLLEELSKLSGLKYTNVEEIFSNDFTHDPKEFFKAILRVKAEVLDTNPLGYEHISYSKIFTDGILAFLNTKSFLDKLGEYCEKYNELIDSSIYFKRGTFNHYNAETIAKNLKKNGFFQANHTVSLHSKDSSRTITTEAELEAVIEEEKQSILQNADLKKAFEEIDKKMGNNNELREFREFLSNNKEILPELMNLNLFKEKLWISYLKKIPETYSELEKKYSNGRKEIETIVEKAGQEITRWNKVIGEFNQRFFVPFRLSISNQEDVILKQDTPSIKFEFCDEDEDPQKVEKQKLLTVLSNGELRALYILNVIFEVQARLESSQGTIFIIDDIADSFDYKNKYAIVEYLKDIENQSIFKQVILTHNFDFFRTITNRLGIQNTHKLFTVRDASEVRLEKDKYSHNPFKSWKTNFHKTGNEAQLIASIPLIRNLAEYAGDDHNKRELTKLLHIKVGSDTFNVGDLQSCFNNVLSTQCQTFPDQTKPVLDLIDEVAKNIVANTTVTMDLENKIVLAIAIRLDAERYMIAKINDPAFCSSITRYQTRALYDKFVLEFPDDTETIKVLERVNLMTPENIHLNSFMYEPILDMADDHLRQLYNDVAQLK